MLPVRRQLEGPDLERLLDQVKTEYGDAARIVQAEKVRTGGVGGFFARERFHIDVEIPDEPGAPAEPAAPAAPRSLLDLVERVSEEERELAAEPAREAAGRLSTESPSFEAVLAALRREEVMDPPDDRQRFSSGPRKGITDDHGTAAVPGPGPTVALRRDGLLGIPADVLPPHAVELVPDRPEAAYGALVTWLRSVPAVPPPAYAPGQIVAIVGDVAAALRVARVIAGELGADPEAIVVAQPSGGAVAGVPTRRRIADPTRLAQQRMKWSRKPDSTLVVVSAPMSLRPAGWAAAALAALAPTFTWGVAHATTKPHDVARWAQRVGGVDALALEDVEATSDPAAVLTGPIPVGLIDGHRATPAVWASLLTERLAVAR